MRNIKKAPSVTFIYDATSGAEQRDKINALIKIQLF
ncbi:Uncharacterised protein [Legionella moravica]|uniref:Uncharacterized protein n=1 Tax=Legionella moravica TaxID=39962 RepID=A0A378JYG7_9GAMM|nr:Uncharacterised protein [Legionella moravica]